MPCKFCQCVSIDGNIFSWLSKCQCEFLDLLPLNLNSVIPLRISYIFKIKPAEQQKENGYKNLHTEGSHINYSVDWSTTITF